MQIRNYEILIYSSNFHRFRSISSTIKAEMSTNPFDDDADMDGERRRTNRGGQIAESGGGDPIGGEMSENPNVGDEQQQQQDGSSGRNGGQGGGGGQFPSSYDYMAKRLLEDNFVLTALEFHAELLESGRELRRLRDYFSNPVHFESVATASNRLEFLPSTLPRTSSAQTLDSLDFTRYSDDGDRQADDRVAVLEFELRKAKDTIRGLREQLTVASESRAMTRDGESNDTLVHHSSYGGTGGGGGGGLTTSGTFTNDVRHNLSNIPLKPHEKRAISFLVHEFLLQNEHKLTAVTFSDEVDDQDFEDWDDVGLNVPRPADLHTMYREFCSRTPGYVQRKDASCSANITEVNNPFFESIDGNQTELLNKLNQENGVLMERNQHLEGEIERVTNQVRVLQKDLEHSTPTRNVIINNEKSPSLNTTRVKADSREEKNVSERNVPSWLKEKVISLIVKPIVAGNRTLPEITPVPSTHEALVDVLSTALPRIIPHVLLNKREEVIGPLLAVAALHPDSKTRDQLLNAYFGLIKRPDEEQRQLLINGCIAYTEAVGAVRAETELLPQCWEQMNHKHVERRLLVAETCGAIIPYLPPSVGSSLILSMLQQMLAEDKLEQVREAVVRSLAILCNFVEDRDKFNQLSDLTQKTLIDSNEQVIQTARSILVPSLGYWSLELGQMNSNVIGLFVKRISQLVLTSGVNQAANEQLLCTYFSALRSLTPLLFWSILRSGPYCEDAKSTKRSPGSSAELELTRFPQPDGLLDDVSAFFPDRKEFASLIASYDEYTSREWYQTWDQLDYFTKEMIPQLATVLAKLDPTLMKVIHMGVAYFRHLVKTFGRGISVTKLRPIFTGMLHLPSENTDKYDLAAHAIAYSALPVYAAGILGAHHTDADKKELRAFLKTAVVSISIQSNTYNSILTTFSELSVSYPDSELFLGVIWDLITHKTVNVRRLCALILSRLVRSMNDETCLRTKLVPALITLASDRESQVRAATMPGFGAALEISVSHEDITEKIRMQLAAMLEENQSTDVIAQLLRMFAQSAPNLDAKFRDDFVLPQMAILCARNNASSNSESKSAIASSLFDAYSALSCCYLSPNAVNESFLPGLKGLLKDLDVERAKIARSIIRDLENKMGSSGAAGDRKQNAFGPTEIAVDEMKVKMMTKFRDLKDKMDQHKENVPNLFKKK